MNGGFDPQMTELGWRTKIWNHWGGLGVFGEDTEVPLDMTYVRCAEERRYVAYMVPILVVVVGGGSCTGYFPFPLRAPVSV